MMREKDDTRSLVVCLTIMGVDVYIRENTILIFFIIIIFKCFLGHQAKVNKVFKTCYTLFNCIFHSLH